MKKKLIFKVNVERVRGLLFTFFKVLLFSSVPQQPGLKSEKLDGLSLRKGRCKEDLQDVLIGAALLGVDHITDYRTY